MKDDIGGGEVEMEDVGTVYEADARHDLLHEELTLVLRQVVLGGRQSLKEGTT